MADARGKLPGIRLIPPQFQPIQNGVTAASFPAKGRQAMAISDGAGKGTGAAIYDPITRRAMNGITMRGEGFRHHSRRLGPK
jgi:hypothetical protein